MYFLSPALPRLAVVMLPPALGWGVFLLRLRTIVLAHYLPAGALGLVELLGCCFLGGLRVVLPQGKEFLPLREESLLPSGLVVPCKVCEEWVG